ncbi:MAG: metallophosphoesterase family protein [Bacteroidales bacterium]|nr:metallophosphoesterase family protein [Bacteroidales bacterium]
MKHFSIVFTLITLLFLSCPAAAIEVKKKTDLSYREDGTFKIVQFTDLHLVRNMEKNRRCLSNLDYVMEQEKPDLIVITGDLIFDSHPKQILDSLAVVLRKYDTPYAIVFGNHDCEQGLGNEELLKHISKESLCLSRSTIGVSGDPNFDLVVKDAKGKPSWVLYFIDSGSMSDIDDGYAYIAPDRIDWYKRRSERFERLFGGKVPGMMFFHIPLPEYAMASAICKYKGNRLEKECAPQLNSGMFFAACDRGDIKAFFVGHDHDNDYEVKYHNVWLCYGRYSGTNEVYNNLKPNGARVIVLNSKQSGKFHTYVVTSPEL